MRRFRPILRALWHYVLLVASAYAGPSVKGWRQPIYILNGFGRAVLLAYSWCAPRLGRRAVFGVVQLSDDQPGDVLVSQVQRLYHRVQTETAGALSEQWRDATRTVEGHLTAEALRQFRGPSAISGVGYMSGGGGALTEAQGREIVRSYHRFAASLADPLLMTAVSESEVGSPSVVVYRRQRLTHNLVRHAMHVGRISEYVDLRQPLTVLEIGGGYGSLARLLKSDSPRSTVILVDIPPSLALALYYLSSTCPQARIVYPGYGLPEQGPLPLEGVDFALLPDTWLARLPDHSVDLVINTLSMQEMVLPTLTAYVTQIERLCSGHFYCYNRLHAPARYGGISLAQYPIDTHWRPLRIALSSEGVMEVILRRQWDGLSAATDTKTGGAYAGSASVTR